MRARRAASCAGRACMQGASLQRVEYAWHCSLPARELEKMTSPLDQACPQPPLPWALHDTPQQATHPPGRGLRQRSSQRKDGLVVGAVPAQRVGGPGVLLSATEVVQGAMLG